MKVAIEAESQEEFDAKRPDLIKALAGEKFEVAVTPIGTRKAYFTAQNEMMTYWNAQFRAMLDDLKKDIEAIMEAE